MINISFYNDALVLNERLKYLEAKWVYTEEEVAEIEEYFEKLIMTLSYKTRIYDANTLATHLNNEIEAYHEEDIDNEQIAKMLPIIYSKYLTNSLELLDLLNNWLDLNHLLISGLNSKVHSIDTTIIKGTR